MSDTTTIFENKPLTHAYFRDTLIDTVRGVRLTSLGEDGEWYVADGYVSNKDFHAAINEIRGVDCGLTRDEFTGASIDQGWVVVTPHMSACTGLYTAEDAEDGPCLCAEYDWWLGDMLSDVAEANTKRTNAFAVTMWRC